MDLKTLLYAHATVRRELASFSPGDQEYYPDRPEDFEATKRAEKRRLEGLIRETVAGDPAAKDELLEWVLTR
jgi:hypothetical protein